jgi:hypothetical protein
MSSFLWSVADLLRGKYKPHQYGRVCTRPCVWALHRANPRHKISVSSERRCLGASQAKQPSPLMAIAPFLAANLTLPEEERLAVLQGAFFASGHDARPWLEGWSSKTLAMQRAGVHGLNVADYWAGERPRCSSSFPRVNLGGRLPLLVPTKLDAAERALRANQCQRCSVGRIKWISDQAGTRRVDWSFQCSASQPADWRKFSGTAKAGEEDTDLSERVRQVVILSVGPPRPKSRSQQSGISPLWMETIRGKIPWF